MDLYSSIRGFSSNGKHNHDVGVVMNSKTIQSPSKKKIKQSVPFMNGSYDFSTIATNGEITYDDRQIKVKLGLPARSKEHLEVMYSNTLEWLEDTGKTQLIFDDMPDYYFMAEVEESSSLDETMSYGELEVTFVADPLKTSVDYAGEEKWDTFNFELDAMQDVGFDVIGETTVSIYNCGRSICPLVNCSTNMSIIHDNQEYDLVTGDNKYWSFKLQNGMNNIYINGTGYIKFRFRKEML